MSFDCVILYGNSTLPMSKYAGTFRIATELRNYGYSVQTIDITAFKGFDDDLKLILDNIITNKTLWLGISTTFLSTVFDIPYFKNKKNFEDYILKNKKAEENIQKFVNFVKSKNSNIKLIAGGSRRFLLERYGFKIFTFYNDNEIIEFTDQCSKNSKLTNLKYISNLIQGSEFHNFSNSYIEFLENDIVSPEETLPIEISRGCIFKCKFCSFPMNGKSKGEWIKKSAVLLDEFKRNYDNFQTTNYIFSDDTYNDSEDKVKILYDEVFSKLPFKINFTTYLRLDLLIRFPDTVDYLANSGLASALFGIETINHQSAKTIGKGIEPKVQFEFVKELKLGKFKNISTFSGFILGLPNDRPDEMERLEEFLFSDQNYLDGVAVEPLYITPKDPNVNKSYYSTFDLEYEKYGYECYTEEGNSAFIETQWKNKNLSFDFIKAFQFTRILNKKIQTESTKFKYSGFALPYYVSMGVPINDLLSMNKKQIQEKYDLKKLITNKIDNYKLTLKTISTKK